MRGVAPGSASRVRLRHAASDEDGRDAEPGEELVLVSHDPFDVDSPYRSASPIFLHRHPCGEPMLDAGLPAQLTGRQLGVRAFDGRAMMTDAAIIVGTALDATVRRMLGDPDVDHLQVYNATRGCWAVRVERAPVA